MRLFILLNIFFQIIAVVTVYAGEPYNNEIKINIKAFLSYLEDNRFKEASDLFHYPSGYTKVELFNEKKDVQNSLRIYKNEFGRILEVKRGEIFNKAIGLGVSGAKIEYWSKKRDAIGQIIFNVNYKNEGKGFLKMGFCKIKRNWELQSVEFALPESEYAKSRISEIIKKFH